MNPKYPDVRFPGWEVVRKLGQGSFGGVYEIQRPLPDGRTERGALKKLSVPHDREEIEEMLSKSFSTESITAHYKDQMGDLVREYSLMQELGSCGNVVTCHDIQYVQQEDGLGWDVYIRMELLRPLKKALGQEYREETVLKLGLDLCNALKACQKKNIIHRDIKPENILVSEDGDFKLTDFGIAKVSEKTGSGTLAGTNGYMAPEVANRKPYGASADIYSLGMVLYWMMNERTLPFLPLPPAIPSALQRQEAFRRRLDGERLPLPVNGSRGLKQIVLKACAFEPQNRYHTAGEILEDLKALRENHQAKPENIWSDRSKTDDTRFDTYADRIAASFSDETEKTVRAFNGKDENAKRQPITDKHEHKKENIKVLGAAVSIGVLVLILSITLLGLKKGRTPFPSLKPELRNTETTEAATVPTAHTVAPTAAPTVPTPSSATISTEAETVPTNAPLLPAGYIDFGGKYEQDNNKGNGAESIEWIVLTVEDDRALLLSRYGLDSVPYHSSRENTTWEACSLKEWLNTTFLYTAFSEEERQRIIPTKNESEVDSTADMVFLLSVEEIDRYIPTVKDRTCELTPYALAMNACERTNSSGDNVAQWWWTRSLDTSAGKAIFVNFEGEYYPCYVENHTLAVRPAIWISL